MADLVLMFRTVYRLQSLVPRGSCKTLSILRLLQGTWLQLVEVIANSSTRVSLVASLFSVPDARRNSVDALTWSTWEKQPNWPAYPRFQDFLREFLAAPLAQLQAAKRSVRPPDDGRSA